MLARSRGSVTRFALALFVTVGLSILAPCSAAAGLLPFLTTESSKFLLIGTGADLEPGIPGSGIDVGGTTLYFPNVGEAVNVLKFELGAMKAPVPSTGTFLTGGPQSKPDLLGMVPNIPLIAKAVNTGIGGHGNVAITHPNGVFDLQKVGVYADLGILVAPSIADADGGTLHSFFNDPNQFPNTFVADNPSTTAPANTKNITGMGLLVTKEAADQSTRIDSPNSAGVTGNVDFTNLLDELYGVNGAKATIEGSVANATLNLTANEGKINKDLYTAGKFSVTGSITAEALPDENNVEGKGGTFLVTLQNSGVTIIDVVTSLDGTKDLLLENFNFVIDGPEDAFAIFRLPEDGNFKISNANLLAGENIGYHNILFYTGKEDDDEHFSFDNTILNGVAFWSLGLGGGQIHIDEAQGSTQLIANKIMLEDVRFDRWAFGGQMEPIPEPSSLVLMGIGLIGMMGYARRRRRS